MSLSINIVLGADTVNFTRSIKQVNIQTQKAMTDIQNNVNRATAATEKLTQVNQDSAKKLQFSWGGVANTVAIVGAAFASVKGIIETQRQFDVLNASLITATGSVQAANEKMAELREFANKTPYDLNQAVEGFNKLKNLGLDPSIDSLTSFGNTASAMGKDLNQMIEAVADASTGEFERLKEFGIKASKQGNQISLTFQGVTTTIANNSQAIQKYLTDIGNVQFATAMSERMNTLDGAISMLSGSWQSLQLAIMNTQFGDFSLMSVLKEGAKAAATAIDWVANNLQHIANVLGVVFAPALTMMAARFLSAKLSADSLAGSFIANTRASIANAVSTERLGNALMAWANGTTSAQMAMHRYRVSLDQLKTSTFAYIGALRGKSSAQATATAAINTTTVATHNATRANIAATAAKRALIATSVTAARGVMGIGTAFAAVGRIILAHPIMTIAAVISAVIVRTMGLQKAMESLSDAVGIVGSMLGDLIDVGIDGFKWLGGVADRFFSGFISSGKQSTGFVGKYFGWLFEGTEGGFVGLLQVIARVADKFVGFFYAATRAIYRNMVSLWNSLKQGFADAFNSVSKTVETSINAVLDTYDKVIGKVNGLIRDAKAAASVVGLEDLVPNERATIGYRVQAITIQPVLTENIGGSFYKEWQGFNHVSNYVDGEITNQKAQNALKNQDSLANSVDGLAKSLDKAKGVNDAAAKAGKSLTDAHKNQQQQVDKTSDAYKKLLEAYNSKMIDWQKAMWENQHVKAGLEVEKIEWEFTADGGFAKASNAIKNNLRLQALELDRSNAIKEIQAKTREIERSHLEFGTAYEEIMTGIHDETNKLSALLRDVGVEATNLDDITEIVKNAQSSLQADGSVDLGQTQLIIHRWQALQKFKADSIAELKKLATAEVNAAELATHKTLDELDLQLESLGSQSELARQLLTIDNERNASIKKYSRMIDHIKSVDGELAKSLKDRVTANADLIAEKNTELVVTQAYQNIVSELKTDEQKRLDTLKEQLDVLGKMAQIDPGKTDQSLGMANDLLGKQLGLDQPVQNGLFGAMQSQRSAYDSKIEQAKQWYKYLQDIFAQNESALTSIAQQEEETRLAIRKQYQQAQIEMTLTTGEQIFGHLADSAKAAWGEQSSTYRTMFATQKAFTIVQAMLSVYKAVSQAFATGLTPYDRAANAASAMVEGFKLVAMIRQIQSPVVGQAHDGIMSVPKSGTWNLEKGERVLPKHTAQNLDNTLSRLQGNNNGKAIVNVKIENYTGASVQQTTDDDGNIRVIVGQELAKQLPAHVNNPNSEFNRSLKNNYQLQRRF